jgi:hypothetical protein
VSGGLSGASTYRGEFRIVTTNTMNMSCGPSTPFQVTNRQTFAMFHNYLLFSGLLTLLVTGFGVEKRTDAPITFSVTEGIRQPIRDRNPIGVS